MTVENYHCSLSLTCKFMCATQSLCKSQRLVLEDHDNLQLYTLFYMCLLL